MERAEDVARIALSRAKTDIRGPLELSVLLTDDAHQRVLNREWRDKDKSTNVLSFPSQDPFEPLFGLIGDISMAYETVKREAQEQEKAFDDHFVHLLVHGVLHIIGYDHENEGEALVMEELETQILKSMGISDPYADE